MKKSFAVGIFLCLLLILPSLVYCQEEQQKKPEETQTSILEQEITIPEDLQFLTRVLFGLKPETKVTLQEFVILIATFIIFFFIIRDVIAFVPFFETTAKSVIGAVLVTLLVGISGGFLLFVDLILSIGSLFGILERWPIFTIVLIFVIFFILGYFINEVLTNLKEKSKIEAARIEGVKTGAAAKVVQQQGEILTRQ